MFGFGGVTVILSVTVTARLANLETSATLVAVMVTEVGVGTFAGAVYSPDVDTVPTVLLPPTTFFADQLTAVLKLPVP